MSSDLPETLRTIAGLQNNLAGAAELDARADGLACRPGITKAERADTYTTIAELRQRARELRGE
ncbi:hypothetical protein [Micromonospora sp. NBC_00421]|uniref:hypothetical protein n=1 Tax=Micromonospora sp. NBC_00421 TaxID=2975976 RepID=UPI002E22BA48